MVWTAGITAGLLNFWMNIVPAADILAADLIILDEHNTTK